MERKKNYDEGAIERTPEHTEIPRWHSLDLSDHKEHDKLIASAMKAVEVYETVDVQDKRQGGYLHIYIDGQLNLVTVLMRAVGRISIDNRYRYACNSFAKIERFYSLSIDAFNSGKTESIITSMDYPGYIAFPRRHKHCMLDILSFNGLSSSGNACVSAWVAIDNGYMTHEEAIDLCGEYNMHLEPFLEKMKELDNN